MRPHMKISQEGLELLKSFEGLSLSAIRLPDGRWTMGHGHTEHAREGARITAEDAGTLLRYDLIPVQAVVNEALDVPVTQPQFDALTCFAFNLGVETFRKSDVLKRVNQGRMTEAALHMAVWRAVAGDGHPAVLDALVRRRAAENALLLSDGQALSPSDLIRPQIDPRAAASLPEQRPAVLQIVFSNGEAKARLERNPRSAQAAPGEAETLSTGPFPEAGDLDLDLVTPVRAVAERVERPQTVDAPPPQAAEDPVLSSGEGGVIMERSFGAPPKSGWGETLSSLTVGVAGLFAFGAGLYGIHQASQTPAPSGGFDQTAAIGWVLVLIGVLCVWIFTYDLFRQLGSSED